MRRLIKPERISGIVALSYLVLIPAGGYAIWRRVKDIDADVYAITNHLDMTGNHFDMPVQRETFFGGLRKALNI